MGGELSQYSDAHQPSGEREGGLQYSDAQSGGVSPLALSLQTKCEVYWPRDVGSSGVYGLIEVTLKYYTHLADYTIRTFTVQKVRQ